MSITYREQMGYSNPPAGTELKIEHLPGVEWYLLWPSCPDQENIVAGWFGSKSKALAFANKHGWVINL